MSIGPGISISNSATATDPSILMSIGPGISISNSAAATDPSILMSVGQVKVFLTVLQQQIPVY